MKLYHKNPRQITKKQYSDLETWLRELGDLSGIVHDLNSDEIIGGNQRSRILDINACEIMIEEPHEPDEQGTVAQGYAIWEGKKYSYRQVRWTPEQCEKGNIVANKAGGGFDFDILANQFELQDLLEFGFEKFELGVFPTLPTLDDMKDKHPGDPGERDFWPVVKVTVSPQTKFRFDALMSELPGDDEAYKFATLLDRLEE